MGLRLIPTISLSPLNSCLFPFLFPFCRLFRLCPYLCPWRPFPLYLYLFLCPWPPVPISGKNDTYDRATHRASTVQSDLKKVDPHKGASSGRQQVEEAEAGNRESEDS